MMMVLIIVISRFRARILTGSAPWVWTRSWAPLQHHEESSYRWQWLEMNSLVSRLFEVDRMERTATISKTTFPSLSMGAFSQMLFSYISIPTYL